MGFFLHPWVWAVLAFAILFLVLKRQQDKNIRKAKIDSLAVGKTSQNVARTASKKSVSKTTYRCRSCPQHFEPPHLFYVCPVCRSPVDKYENGVVVDEVNPAFPKSSVSSYGTLPFVRKTEGDKKLIRVAGKPSPSAPSDNVVALNPQALQSLQSTCWLVVSADSSSLAQTLADQSPNFRVLHRKSPKRLSKNRWLVWGKARSAA